MVWSRLGRPKQYIEPFCGSAAVLLAAHAPASLEVIGDANGFVANFWRGVVFQPDEVAAIKNEPGGWVRLGAGEGAMRSLGFMRVQRTTRSWRAWDVLQCSLPGMRQTYGSRYFPSLKTAKEWCEGIVARDAGQL